jgi:hypothetical protein
MKSIIHSQREKKTSLRLAIYDTCGFGFLGAFDVKTLSLSNSTCILVGLFHAQL